MSAADRTRIPIKVEDIRVGDLIRMENGREGAHEWRAVTHGYSAWPNAYHLRLDRPALSVVLPTVPTLGWLNSTLSVWYHDDGLMRLARVPAVLSSHVTAFTPATAVPTEALDALRGALTGPDSDDEYVSRGAVERFLAAADKTTP